jgi:hypothetical protein
VNNFVSLIFFKMLFSIVLPPALGRKQLAGIKVTQLPIIAEKYKTNGKLPR